MIPPTRPESRAGKSPVKEVYRHPRHEELCQRAFHEAVTVFQDGDDRFIYPQTYYEGCRRSRVDAGQRVLSRRNDATFLQEELVGKLMQLVVSGSSVPFVEVPLRDDKNERCIVSPFVHFVPLETLAETKRELAYILHRLTIDSQVALLEIVALQPSDLSMGNIGVRLAETHPLAKYSGCSFVGPGLNIPSVESLYLHILQGSISLDTRLTPKQGSQILNPFMLSSLFPTMEDAEKQQYELIFPDTEYSMYESNNLLRYYTNHNPRRHSTLPHPLHTIPMRCYLLETGWAKGPLQKEVLVALSNEEKMLPVVQEAELPDEQSKEAVVAALKERWQRRKDYLQACKEFESAPLERDRLQSFFRVAEGAIVSSEKERLLTLLESDLSACRAALRPYMVPSIFSIACVMYPVLADIIAVAESIPLKENLLGCYLVPLETIIFKYLAQYRAQHHSSLLHKIREAICYSHTQNPSALLFDLYTQMKEEDIDMPDAPELDHIFTAIRQGTSGVWFARDVEVRDPNR